MKISMVDSYSGTLDVLAAPPADRPQVLRQMRSLMDGMYPFIPGGPDQVVMHRGTFGFPLDRDGDRVRSGLDALKQVDAWGRVERGLIAGVAALASSNPRLQLADLTVLLTIGDPGDDHFMHEIQGLSAFGGISGYIELTLWPNPVVVERLEAIAVHELHHNVRYGPGGIRWNPMTVAVGEQVVAEGLADRFARDLYGNRGYTHFAQACLADEEVLRKVVSGLDVTGMANFVSWVHGDASARRFGAEPVGLPTGAGYAAGNRIVDAYLSTTGRSAAEAVHDDYRDVIDTGLAALGLSTVG